MINARAETVSEKPAYRTAFRTSRCLVPANGWFEWQGTRGTKQPWFITPADGSPLSFAALWERWDKTGDPVETFTIITTEACQSLTQIHHRQPAIIQPEDITQWLDPISPSDQLLDLVPSQSEKWGKDHAMCTPASRGRAEMDGFRHPCISR